MRWCPANLCMPGPCVRHWGSSTYCGLLFYRKWSTILGPVCRTGVGSDNSENYGTCPVYGSNSSSNWILLGTLSAYCFPRLSFPPWPRSGIAWVENFFPVFVGGGDTVKFDGFPCSGNLIERGSVGKGRVHTIPG